MRYNAEKKKIGMYYSTPIWSFRMKCHLCDNWFEIQTDPKVRFLAPYGISHPAQAFMEYIVRVDGLSVDSAFQPSSLSTDFLIWVSSRSPAEPLL